MDWCPGLLSARLVQIRFLEDEESLMAAGETAGPSTSLRYGPSTSGRDDDKGRGVAQVGVVAGRRETAGPSTSLRYGMTILERPE